MGDGTVLLQSLPASVPKIGMSPLNDEVVRLQAVSPRIEAGQLPLPARAPWLDTGPKTPNGKH
jgi:phage terminase large subunit-like protein